MKSVEAGGKLQTSVISVPFRFQLCLHFREEQCDACGQEGEGMWFLFFLLTPPPSPPAQAFVIKCKKSSLSSSALLIAGL